MSRARLLIRPSRPVSLLVSPLVSLLVSLLVSFPGAVMGQAAPTAADAAQADAGPPEVGATRPGLVLGVGLLVGQRRFAASAPDSTYSVEHAAPLAGARGSARLRLVRLGNGEVWSTLQGAYAPMSVEMAVDGAEPFSVSGHHLTGRATLGYRHWAGALYVGAELGADAVSSTLAPNSYFTGSRYLSLLGMLGGGYQGDAIGLGASVGLLPVVGNNTSGNAYGETSGLGLAYTGRASLSVMLTATFGVELGYHLRLYPTDYAEPTLAATPVATDDLIHGGSLSVILRL